MMGLLLRARSGRGDTIDILVRYLDLWGLRLLEDLGLKIAVGWNVFGPIP